MMMLSLALTTMLSMAQAAAPTPADFSGTWVLDASRSEGLPPGLQQTMTVRHAGDRVEIETRMTGPQGDRTISDLYVLDGSAVDFAPALVSGGTAKGKRTSRWLADRRSFEAIEQATAENEDGPMTLNVERKWTLAPDGGTLTIVMTTRGPQGEMTSTRVFTKQ